MDLASVLCPKCCAKIPATKLLTEQIHGRLKAAYQEQLAAPQCGRTPNDVRRSKCRAHVFRRGGDGVRSYAGRLLRPVARTVEICGVLVIAAIGFASSQAWAGNLVVNGTFDHDLSGWTLYTGGARWDAADAHGKSSSGSMQIGGPGLTFASQCIQAAPTSTYYFSASGRGNNLQIYAKPSPYPCDISDGSVAGGYPISFADTLWAGSGTMNISPQPLAAWLVVIETFGGGSGSADDIYFGTEPPPVENFRLLVSRTGTGTGTVTSAGGTISCGTTCSGIYPFGTLGTLTAKASLGSVFSGWAGDCSGVSPDCHLTMTQDRSVSARFDTASCTLSCTATAPITGTTRTPITFSANASGCNDTTYSWDFGDHTTSPAQNPTHTYNTSGTYIWTLTATANGQTCTKSSPISITSVTPPVSTTTPTIFIGGYCSDASTWTAMIKNLQATGRYGPRVDVAPGNPVQECSTTGSLRRSSIYVMSFSPPSDCFDTMTAKDIAIEALAGQLAEIIPAVLAANNAKQVDLVAHSMGGLVARALVEGLASGNSTTGADAVRRIITIDTPHGGAAMASWLKYSGVCVTSSNVQRSEMDPNNTDYDFLKRLNNLPIPPNTQLTAIASTAICGVASSPCIPPGAPSPFGDGVVTYASQNITSQDLYRCQDNIRLIWNPVFLDHSAVHDAPEVATRVDQLLRAQTSTVTCRNTAVGTALTVASPATSGANLVGFTATFTPALNKAADLATCSATVTIVSATGNVLATATVPATDTQTVTLGVIPGGNWHAEIQPSCATTITANIDVWPIARQRAVAH